MASMEKKQEKRLQGGFSKVDEGSDEIINFAEIGDDLSFSLTACVTGSDEIDIDRDDFMELSQEDIYSGISSNDLETKILSLGISVRAFYQVPEELDKPVGLRRFPHKNSPRTGDALFPGEVVETAQEVIIDDIKFVRAVGICTGWLFVKHPLMEKVMLDYLPGEITDEFRTYLYKLSQPNPISILSGPHVACQKTSHVVFPGEEVDICETWKPADGSGLTYVKLADGRGWVELVHPVSGETMFEELIA